MSALPRSPERHLLPMSTAHLDAVMAIEAAAYAFPWSRGNFVDSLAAGYTACVLYAEEARIVGYFVAMAGVEEMHLLNITVARDFEHRGHARFMLAELAAIARRHGARQLWLEVRLSNARAKAMYERIGFVPVGVRRGYYPAPHGRREDAQVMSWALDGDALD